MKRNRITSSIAVMALVVGIITATPSIALAQGEVEENREIDLPEDALPPIGSGGVLDEIPIDIISIDSDFPPGDCVIFDDFGPGVIELEQQFQIFDEDDFLECELISPGINECAFLIGPDIDLAPSIDDGPFDEERFGPFIEDEFLYCDPYFDPYFPVLPGDCELFVSTIGEDEFVRFEPDLLIDDACFDEGEGEDEGLCFEGLSEEEVFLCIAEEFDLCGGNVEVRDISEFDDFIACVETELEQCEHVNSEEEFIACIEADELEEEVVDEGSDDQVAEEAAEEAEGEAETDDEETIVDEVVEDDDVVNDAIDAVVDDDVAADEDESEPEFETHTVAPGETLAQIAAEYEVTVSAVLAVNAEISNPNVIFPGQAIVIPNGSVEAAPTADVGNVADGGVVTVAPGQTLSGIASANGVTVTQLLRANPSITNPDLILIGQQIVIPDGPADDEPLAFADGHLVRRGDTLSAIAGANNLTVAALLDLNPQITNPDLIIVGDIIVLLS